MRAKAMFGDMLDVIALAWAEAIEAHAMRRPMPHFDVSIYPAYQSLFESPPRAPATVRAPVVRAAKSAPVDRMLARRQQRKKWWKEHAE